MQTAFMIIVPLGIVLLAFEGFRHGAFFALYCFVRNLLAFMAAMTFCEPATELFLRTFPRLELHPGPLYWRVIFFALIFGVVFGVARWLKLKFTPPHVRTITLVDKVAGPVIGLANGYILTGFVLILWSLMPFAKYIPGDNGRMDPDRLVIDSGTTMLKYYAFATHRMGGSRRLLLENEPVPEKIDTNKDGKPDKVNDNGDGLWQLGEAFEDLNDNGKWDVGWLWRYRHFADIGMNDLELARSIVITMTE